ncbi:MAG: tRNA (N6-isopentenyl adenosine(37)-C2)-methylthiotransferase MiaB, partial [Eubacteriaceae bacterium]|nr:tRNA (N6-isopentenyl adenosine(37)-C2)-methylthiotransferase MiaB [Eubacteriaceae bacterium]
MYEKYKIITFGCQMNENDSEKISGMLSEMGYLESDDAAECSVIVINTCSVRGNADDKFFGALGQLKQLKQAKPETVICVCGCMMQQEVFRNEIKEKYRFVDIIFGTH